MIIAECGINWKADIELAKRLIQEAKLCGGDLAKFQLYDTDAFPAYGNDADWNSEATKNYAIDKRHELTFDQAKGLFEYGKGIGIEVFFSVFTAERVKWCEEIGVKRYKVATTMRDENVLEAVAQTNKPVIMSENCELGYDGGYHCGSTKARVDYLYCVPDYPAKVSDYLAYDRPHYGAWGPSHEGISDHTIGLDAAKIALARGAEIIEKHFCLTREGQEDNPGIAGSMTPDELKELVRWQNICKEVL